MPAKKMKASKKSNLKQYIGISRDHSGSMSSLSSAASKDYTNVIRVLQEAARIHNIETKVSVVRCGVGHMGRVEREADQAPLDVLQPLSYYTTDGGSTPLFDSVGELISMLERAPDARDENVSFLVTVITDGEENSSRLWNANSLSRRMKELQATDRWTFSFRVPRGHKQHLAQLGIPEGNILEWELTEQGMERASRDTVAAVSSYYVGRTRGITSTKGFYADLKNVKPCDVKDECMSITNEVTFWKVPENVDIKTFVEKKNKQHIYTPGTAFYQLSKPEARVQDYKMICVRNKKSGAVYGGNKTREMLGLPSTGNVRLSPGNHGAFDIFIQSSSTNRRLMPGTEVMHWPNARND